MTIKKIGAEENAITTFQKKNTINPTSNYRGRGVKEAVSAPSLRAVVSCSQKLLRSLCCCGTSRKSERSLAKVKKQELAVTTSTQQKVSYLLGPKKKEKQKLLQANAPKETQRPRSEYQDEIEAAKKLSPKFDRDYELLKIGLKAARSGDLDTAFEIVDISQYFHAAEILEAIGIKHTENGDLDEALKVSDLIDTNILFKRLYQGNIYIAVSKILVKQGKIDSALQTVKKIDGFYTQSRAISDICKILKTSKNILKFVGTADAIDDDSNRGFALSAISSALADCEDLENAIDVISKMEKDVIRGFAIEYVAEKATSDVNKTHLHRLEILANEIPCHTRTAKNVRRSVFDALERISQKNNEENK